jgi:hypothetical protein
MGEGTNRIAQSNGSPARVRELGNETDAVRRQLDELVMELDRRRHELFDWRLQMRRHARALALIAGGIIVVVGMGVGVSMARSRRQHTLAAHLAELADRGERLRRALGRIIDDPDRLAPKEPPRRRVDIPTVASVALGVARMLLPHIGASMGRPGLLRRR